jgi:hypothetical protein
MIELTKNGFETVRSRETIDRDTRSSDSLDGSSERYNKRFHILLVDLLDECVERSPGSRDDIRCSVVEERHELTNEVDGVVREVGFGSLTESSEEAATGDSLRRRLVLAKAEHVHLQGTESRFVIVDRGEDCRKSFVEVGESVFVFFRLESVLKGVDDVGETTSESGTGDANEGSESTGVEGGNRFGD